MKVEKINDHQIKVMMTREDLANRDITLPEIAYGSAKGRELFAEVMAHAKEACDFSVDDEYPLIIEAIPMSKTELLIIISKIVVPNELQRKLENIGFNFISGNKCERPPLIKKPMQSAQKTAGEKKSAVFSFASLDDVMEACARVGKGVKTKSALYKTENKYYLIAGFESAEDTKRYEKIFVEYGQRCSASPLSKAQVMERGELIARNVVENFAVYV